MSVADRATVEGWCERGEEGRVEAWLEESDRQEKGEEGKLPVEGLLHAATRCDSVQISRGRPLSRV